MTNFKSFNDLVLDILEYLRLTQPSLDIKPNSVARDLMIDGQALQVAGLYDALREVSASQAISNVTGQDLTNYASNFGISRRSGTKSIGTIVCTFRTLTIDVSIPAGSIVQTRNGIPFVTVSNITILTSQANSLRATASRLRNELDIAGITDEFAIELSVEAQSSGSVGNVSKYSVISHNISGVNSVTNLIAFTGGTDLEDDTSFRSRVLATFAGANIGTSLGYRSAILNLSDTIDTIVVEPGDALMTRDGTTVGTNSDGEPIVTDPGTGGKVDIYVMGENLQSGQDGFVFNDQSGQDDPTDSDNDYILGQSSTTADTDLTLNSRRVSTLSGTSEIPTQPISRIVSVSGSISGPNFVAQYTNSVGNTKGNFVLTKDSGDASGSAFGLDKISWTSNQIDLTDESNTKGSLNGVDSLSYTDVLEIPAIRQDVQVTNENSSISSDRQSITTLHSPIKTVNRVYNLTTGERYVISDQNPDGSGSLNETGRIEITGRTLPTASDILQVDYIWSHEYDPKVDFDDLDPKDNNNEAQDSVEWGFSNYIRDEESVAELDSYDNLNVLVDHPISRVLSVNTYITEMSTVQTNNEGKTVEVNQAVSNIHEIKDLTLSGNPEVYNTLADDGSFSNVLITLPTDTLAENGDQVSVTYNLENVFDLDAYDSGTFSGRKITLNPSTATDDGYDVLVNYVANFYNLLPSSNISSLPISTDGYNSFTGIDGYQPTQDVYSGSNVVANQRRSPSRLRASVSSIPGQGKIRFAGTTINKVTAVFSATADTTINLASAIRSAEGLSSSANVPNTTYVSRVVSVEKVTLTAAEEVKTIDLEYDITNYGIKNSRWDRASALEISTLENTQVQLADSTINVANPITTGTILKVVFYYAKENDYEDLFFSRNGTAISDKVFGHISSINRISGMQNSAGVTSGKLVINSFNQPLINSSYFVDYDYTAPKENERITINFEYNKLIVDATEEIEDKRPITADVLVKAATKVELDVEAKIVISSGYENREETVVQDVIDNITSSLSATALGITIDSSDIVDNAYNVDGLDRIRIIRFNKADVEGTKLSITAQNNEYLAPGSVSVEVEER